jgi:hypothetical protein
MLGVEVTAKEDINTGKISPKFSFRDLTEKILNDYKNWSDRIIPGRIWGVIEEAYHNFGVKKVYLFVTDQESRIYNHQDSVYLFEIIKKWFSKQLPDLVFCKEKLPAGISPVKPDDLLPYYFDTLDRIVRENSQPNVFVSIKGGTPQMQTALQIQVMSSAIKKQIFLKPDLKLDKVLDGHKSECLVTCYWRSIQKQKFDTVKTLIQKRWDFDGAREIIKDWNETLEFFQKNVDSEGNSITAESKNLNAIANHLTFAVDSLNLDKNTTPDGKALKRWLNLYTQCRIYWQLDEGANFLTRLGSFYEETLQEIIRELDGEKYFQDDNANNKAIIQRKRNDEKYELWNELESLEKNLGGHEITWVSAKSNKVSLKVQGRYQTTNEQALTELRRILKVEEIYTTNQYKLNSRYSKRNFVQALINIRYPDSQDIWTKIISSLQKLDYWCDQRNNLIHSAKGMSRNTMKNQLEEDRKNWTEEDAKDKYKANPHQACEVNNILGEMTNICLNVNKLLNRNLETDSKYIGDEKDTPYYIYDDVLEKVIQELS